MKPTFSVSVVIPAFNEEKYINKALQSLKKQDYDKPFEIIVVDNGSVDKTCEIAKKFGAKVVFEPRRGAAYARQAGFSKAKGEIIATTDADTIVPANWLSFFVEKFSQSPKIVAVSGMYQFYDGSPILKILTNLFNFLLFLIFRWYSGANLAVRKDAFLAAGGFNLNLSISEDSDLVMRLKKYGKVARIANFKVKTSARRFNKRGLVVGLADYILAHTYKKLIPKNKIIFHPASTIEKK